MAFFRQTRYETKVWRTALATLFPSENCTHKALIKQYPGIKTALRKGFDEKRNTAELGVEIAGIILARGIEELQDRSRCAQIAHDLREWDQQPDSLAEFGANPKAALEAPNADLLSWRIKWGIWWVSILLKDGEVDKYYLNWFKSEMMGALEGKKHDERSQNRIVNYFEEALRPKPEETKAYQMGAQTAEDMSQAVDHLIAVRFKPVSEDYIKLLRERLQGAFSQNEAPPLVKARWELSFFLENVDKLKSDMEKFIPNALSEWIQVADHIGMRDVFDEFIERRIAQFSVNLKEAGINVLGDYATAFRGVDETWRKANPETSAHFPPDID
jgi:hypothetical protein